MMKDSQFLSAVDSHIVDRISSVNANKQLLQLSAVIHTPRPLLLSPHFSASARLLGDTIGPDCSFRLFSTLTIGLSSVISLLNDDVCRVLRFAVNEVLENLLGTVGVSLLGIQRRTGDVGGHGVTATEVVLGSSPWVILGGRLNIPDITSVTTQLTGLQGLCNVFGYTDSSTSGVDEDSTLLHLADKSLVDEALGLLVQWAVDSDHITLCNHVLEGLYPADTDLLCGVLWKSVVVEVEEFLAVEWLEPLEHSVTNSTSSNGTNDLVLKIERESTDVGDVPATGHDLLVSWYKVSEQDQDGHHDVLGHGNDVATGYFAYTDLSFVTGVQVDVVGSDTGSDTELEVLGSGDELPSQVAGMERGTDVDVGINDLLGKLGVGSLLV